MATTRLALWGRLSSLCASDPFRLVQAQSPFDFTAQPTGQIDQVFRLTVTQEAVIGGLNFIEDRTDLFELWIARKQLNNPQEAYGFLLTDVTSITAAIARDGAETSGEYNLVDGGSVEFSHETGKEYAVARLALPINYESTL
jgi:hypothetical protein